MSFAGTARTLVAVGTVSEPSMLATTRAPTPRIGSNCAASGVLKTGTGLTTGSAGVGDCKDRSRTSFCDAGVCGVGVAGAAGATGAGATGTCATGAGLCATGAGLCATGVGVTAADPIKGLASYADDAGADAVSLDISAGDKLTALKLQQARRQLGYFGMRPSDVAYIVSTAGYYDLLEDPDMRKYFDVGPTNATILTGEVARVNGSPILVSDEFAEKVAGEAAVIIVNMRNFILGNLRGMTVKTDDLVKEDSMLLVATRRFGMLQMETGAVARINYVD